MRMHFGKSRHEIFAVTLDDEGAARNAILILVAHYRPAAYAGFRSRRRTRSMSEAQS